MSANDHALAQPRSLPLNISPSLCTGRTYIVTGANVGLGLEAARHLVAAGAGKVIMAVRNVAAGEEAKASIEASTGTTRVAEVWPLDLSSYASVRAFATRAIESLGRIEAVIENAAVASAGGPKVEGHILCLTVNVISTLLLAVLLLPKLREDAARYGYDPRLSIVTSGAAFDLGEYWAKVADDPIVKMDADEELGLRSYPVSKLMEIFAVRQMARLLPLSCGGVIINAVNPGLCETTLSRNAPAAFKEHLKGMWAQCGRTAECGSRTLLAGGVAGKDSHGSYMNDCIPSNDLLREWMDETAEKQCWDSIVKELDKIEPGCVTKALK